jgi:drug/metabolite transporter (DMT)-like permease
MALVVPAPLDTAPLRHGLLLVLAVAGFALVPVFARPLMAGGLTAEATALWRFLPGLLLGLPLLPRLWRTPGKRAAALALALGGLGMGLGWTAYLRGLDAVPVAWAGTVYMSYPLFVVLLAWAWFGARPGPSALASGGLVLGGALVLLLGAPTAIGGLGWGQAWALALCLPAPLAFAAVILLLLWSAPRLTPLERMAASMAGTLTGLLPMALISGGAAGLLPAEPEGWAWLAGLALVTALLPQLLYIAVAPRLSAARVAALGALELPAMVGFGWLLLGEALGPAEAVATACIVAAVLLSPGGAAAPPQAVPETVPERP